MISLCVSQYSPDQKGSAPNVVLSRDGSFITRCLFNTVSNDPRYLSVEDRSLDQYRQELKWLLSHVISKFGVDEVRERLLRKFSKVNVQRKSRKKERLRSIISVALELGYSCIPEVRIRYELTSS